MKWGQVRITLAHERSIAQSKYADIDMQIDSLANFADSYPPDIDPEDTVQLERVTTFFNSVADHLEKLLTADPDNAELEARLGDVYRMGHNLDARNVWEKAEKHLKTAIDLNPSGPHPYFSLGLLYVNTHMKYAPEAEKLFRRSIELSPEGSIPYAYNGLAFAYYYQGNFEEAVIALEILLSMRPDDESAKRMREIALSKLEQR
jgi:tetratricopeptide (TPR) repeat protein